MKLRLPVERTRSRSGRHAATSLVVVIRSGGSVEVITRPSKPSARGTYSRGYAGMAEVELGEGDLAVHAWLVRGPRGRVKGVLRVLDSRGSELLRAVYRKLKVRYSRGDPAYSWAVEEAVRRLGLERYVRKYSWLR